MDHIIAEELADEAYEILRGIAISILFQSSHSQKISCQVLTAQSANTDQSSWDTGSTF